MTLLPKTLVIEADCQTLELATACPVGTGEPNAADNVGGGAEVFRDITTGILNFRTLVGMGATVVSQVGDTIEIEGGETFSTNASRTLLTTNLYLWRDNSPMNISPFVLPFNARLVAISASGALAQTWQAQMHRSLALVAGAVLNITASTQGFVSGLAIDCLAGDELAVFLSGTGIQRPMVDLFFRRIG